MGAREILRVLGLMARPDLREARRLLAMALAEFRLARALQLAGPATLLIPGNDAVLRWLIEGGDRSLEPARSRPFLEQILDHVIVGRVQFRSGQDSVLTTARRRDRSLTWRGGTALVDGIPVRTPGFPIGRRSAYRE